MAPPNTEDSELTYRGVPSQNDESIQKFERGYIPLNFTIKEIRDAIPSHCFQRNTLRSFSYVLRDLLAIAVLAYTATYIDTHLPTPLRYIAWPLYWFFAGAFGTGLWVLAHECGHRSFSPNKYINYTVGFILHSALLVPFHSWRITHARHHKHTSDMERDEVFVPKTRSRAGLPPKDEDPETEYHAIWEDAPIASLLFLIGQHLAGYPLYLTINSSGRVYESDTLINHFNPLAPMFSENQYFDVILSDLGLIAAFSAIGYFSYTFSFLTVLKFYLIPYLVVNHWLVMITFLQHTDPKVPHYRKSWSFVRGAAATVDRHYGFLDTIFHKISSTHVAHHYFSEMPFYHAEEATKHLEKLLGSYYLKDDTPIFKALWNNFRACRFVEDEGDVVFYKR